MSTFTNPNHTDLSSTEIILEQITAITEALSAESLRFHSDEELHDAAMDALILRENLEAALAETNALRERIAGEVNLREDCREQRRQARKIAPTTPVPNKSA